MSRKPERNRRAAEQMDRDAITKRTRKDSAAYCGAKVERYGMGAVGCPMRATYNTPHGPRCFRHARPD